MKTHLDHGGCHLYSAGDKHFLVCKGKLYMVSREQIIKMLNEFEGKTPQENADYTISLVEKETFKKIHI